MSNMSHEDAVAIWNDVYQIATERDLGDILPWLGRVSPVSFDGSVLTLTTKQNWAARKLNGEYRAVIRELLKEITLEDTDIIVETGGMDQAAVPTMPQTVPVNTPRTTPTPAPVEVAAPLMTPTPAPIKETPAFDRFNFTGPTGETEVATILDSYKSQPAQEDDGEVAAPEPIPVVTSEMSSKAKEKAVINRSEYRFDTFITGETNNIAFSMAKAIAEQPDGNINPLFLWGPSGNGKTHLLLSIFNYIEKHQPTMRVLYVPVNQFVESYIDDIRNKNLVGPNVLREYRDVDVLLVDDVQFFESKQESVAAFFDIFNSLILEGKQIVLAADEPPDYLHLDDRMRTRFGQGMVVDIGQPTFEMKMMILKNYYEKECRRGIFSKVEITPVQFEAIAHLSPNNPRKLQGLMRSLMIRAESSPNVLNGDNLRNFINEQYRSTQTIDIPLIIRKVAEERGVSANDIMGSSRTKAVSEARQVVMWMSRQLTDESYDTIGSFLGGRDHSTVYYGIKKIEDRVADKGFLYSLERLKKEIVSAQTSGSSK